MVNDRNCIPRIVTCFTWRVNGVEITTLSVEFCLFWYWNTRILKHPPHFVRVVSIIRWNSSRRMIEWCWMMWDLRESLRIGDDLCALLTTIWIFGFGEANFESDERACWGIAVDRRKGETVVWGFSDDCREWEI